MNISPLQKSFLRHVAQTSPAPLLLEIVRAKGVFLYDRNNKPYFDLISGVSVSNLGHGRPEIIEAVKQQAERYMHLMVYGEFVQSPQVLFAEKLCSLLPEKLDSLYYVNSGAEAVETALKLAKRATGRQEIIAFRKAYHGSTHGAASLMSEPDFTQAFRPLLPGIKFLNFNSISDLAGISNKTACVVAETVQGEAGVIPAERDFFVALRKKCDETGTLLIVDEIQTGFGRTGKLFAFEHYGIVPDIVTIAKAMGAGMPAGAVVAAHELTNLFTFNPVLGHITTFGGHPVSLAAALAGLDILLNEELVELSLKKELLFRKHLIHPKIKTIRGKGLLLAVELDSFETVYKIVRSGLDQGFISDWFLFNDSCFRISPPLIISEEEIANVCKLIIWVLDNV